MALSVLNCSSRGPVEIIFCYFSVTTTGENQLEITVFIPDRSFHSELVSFKGPVSDHLYSVSTAGNIIYLAALCRF